MKQSYHSNVNGQMASGPPSSIQNLGFGPCLHPNFPGERERPREKLQSRKKTRSQHGRSQLIITRLGRQLRSG